MTRHGRLRVVRHSLALLAALIGIVVAPPRPTQQPETPRLRTGIAYGDTLVWMSDQRLAQALDDAVDVGAKWIRGDLRWEDVQRDGPMRYRWDRFDRVVEAAAQRGLRVLPILAFTPPWARAQGCRKRTCAPADPAAFAAFAAAAVQRYSPRNVRVWEIWNEPNVDFGEPAPDPAAYAALLRSTSAAMRRADASARLLLGGLASVPTGPESFAQSDFLAAVLRAGGGRFVDAVAYHPYTYPYLASDRPGLGTAWERIVGGPDNLREVLARHGHADMPIWVTEIGAPTGGPGAVSDGRPVPDISHVTEARQAEIATDVIATAAAEPLIEAVFWYADRDQGSASFTNENFFGLRRADGTEKPAYEALRDALHTIRR